MRKRKKTMLIITAVVAVIMIAVIITAIVIATKKTQDSNETEKKEEFTENLTGKFAENEFVKIAIEDMSYVGNNLIIKYDVKAQDGITNLFEDADNSLEEFDFHLNRIIKINSEEIDTNEDLTDQISYKKSNTEVIAYDVIEIDDISEEIDLQVIFYENYYTMGYSINEEIEEEESDSDVVDEEYDEEIEDISEEYEEETNYDFDFEMEEIIEVDYNGEMSYAQDEEQLSNENDNYEAEKIGSIKVKTTRKSLEKDTDIIEMTERYEAENVVVEKGKLIKSPVGNILIVDSKISNVDRMKIDSEENGDPSIYRIDVKDKNGDSLKQGSNQYIEYEDEENFETCTAKIKSIIVLTEIEDENMEIAPYYLVKE